MWGQTAWAADPVLGPHIIETMVRDADGFIWLSTDTGVYRYDGYHTVPLRQLVRGNGAQAPTDQCGLALGQRGDLWLLGRTGLWRYTAATQRLAAMALPTLRPANIGRGRALVADTLHHRLWVASSYTCVLALDLRRGTVLAGSRYHFRRPVLWLGLLAGNQVWAATAGHTVHRLALGHPATTYQGFYEACLFPIPNTRPQQFFGPCARYEAGPTGQLREVQRWLPPGSFRESQIFFPLVSATGTQWVLGRHLVRLGWPTRLGQPVQVQVEDWHAPAESHGYYRLFADGTGTEWAFSPELRGSYRHRRTLGVWSLPLATPGDMSTRAMVRLPGGDLVVSTHTGVVRQPAGQPQAPLRPWPLYVEGAPRQASARLVFDAWLPLASGRLLGAENNGLYLIDVRTGRARQLGGASRPHGESLHVRALARGPGGRIWVGAESGLYWFDSLRLKLHAYPLRQSQPGGWAIETLAPDAAGYLWLGTASGLYCLHPGSGALRHFGPQSPPPYTLPTTEVLSLYPLDTCLWVGTRAHGLLLLSRRRGLLRQLTQAQGLPSNTVCTVLPDAARQLWLGTAAGVARYQPATGQVAILTAANGLANNECNRYSAFRDLDGQLYIGSIQGVTRIDPRRVFLPDASPRQLVVSSLTQGPAGDTTRRVSYPAQHPVPALRLARNDEALVQVALTDYATPGLTRFSYQLRGRPDTAWQAASGSTIHLSNLPPGPYTLVVRADAHAGHRVVPALALSVRVWQPWWRYPLAWGLAVGLLLSGGLVYEWRRWRQRRRQQAQLRQQLAHDLHDELGAHLVRATLQVQALQSELAPDNAPAAQLLGELASASQAMRDIAWSIDSHHSTLGSMVDRMQEYLAHTSGLAGWQLDFATQGLDDERVVSSVLRQQVYFIFKEAITNALRHARQATTLCVHLRLEQHQLHLLVADDGEPSPPPSPGMGSRSMRQRAAALGGRLAVGPLAGGGFQVQLTVPLKK